jgi:hypothetical protein
MRRFIDFHVRLVERSLYGNALALLNRPGLS